MKITLRIQWYGREYGQDGYGKKTVLTDTEQVEIEVPRDRNATFEPLAVPKRQRRIPGIDEKIISMYARGMSTREISAHIEEIYSIEVSAGRLAEYVDRLEMASAATVDFDRWIKERSRPTVMVRFGDHQPALRWKAGYQTNKARPDYITDYTLVDNQVQDKEEALPLTDIVFLPSMILERVGVPMGHFYETTDAMKSLCQGLYQDCTDKRLLKAYQNEIYVNQRIAE